MFALFARGSVSDSTEQHEHVLIYVFVCSCPDRQSLFDPPPGQGVGRVARFAGVLVFARGHRATKFGKRGWGLLLRRPIQMLPQLIHKAGLGY